MVLPFSSQPLRSRALSLVRLWLRRTALTLIFFLSIVVGAIAHLDLPIARNATRTLLESYLNKTLRGTIRIGEITRLTQSSVVFRDIVILDPDERRTIRVKNLSGTVDTFDIFKRTLSDNSKLSVQVPLVRAEGFDLYLHPSTMRDKRGQLVGHTSLRDTFELNTQTTSKKTPSRQVRIWFPHVELVDVYSRGAIGGSPLIEAKIPHAQARVLATEKGATIDVERFALTTSGLAGVDSSVFGEVHVRAPGPVWGKVAGAIGEVPFEQEFRFDGDEIDIQGQFPELNPHSLRPLLGTWPLDRPIYIQSHIFGKAPDFHITGEWGSLVTNNQHASPEKPHSIQGNFSLSPHFQAKFQLKTTALNLKDYLSTLPASNLSGHVLLNLALPPEGPALQVDLKMAEGHIALVPTPQVNAVGSYKEGQWKLDATLLEKGLQARFNATKGPQSPVSFEIHLDESNLANSPRIQRRFGKLAGLAQGKLTGTYDNAAIEGQAVFSLGGLRYKNITSTHALLQLKGHLNLSTPDKAEADINIETRQINLGGPIFKSLSIRATGPVLSPALSIRANTLKGARLSAQAKAQFMPFQLRNLEGRIEGKGKPILAGAERILVEKEHLLISTFYLESIGKIGGDIEILPHGAAIDVSASNLNISRISGALGLKSFHLAGDLDAKVVLNIGKESEGTLQLKIADGTYQGVTGLNLDVDAEIHKNKTKGTLSADLSRFGQVKGAWDGELGGYLLSADSFLQAHGIAQIQVSELDLSRLNDFIPPDQQLKLGGKLNMEASSERHRGEEFPTFQLALDTKGLTLKDKERTLRGVDLNFVTSVRTGGNRLDTALRLNDRRGSLASVSGSVELPLVQWLNNLPALNDFRDQLLEAPLNLVFVLPRREMRDWPRAIAKPIDEGRLSARVALKGSLLEPNFNFLLEGASLKGGKIPLSDALDLKLGGSYSALSGDLRGNLSMNRGERRLGSSHFDLNIPWRYFLAPPPPEIPIWTGSASLLLENAPLELAKELRQHQIDGRVQGALQIERQGMVPHLSGDFYLRRIKVAGRRLGDARINLQSHEDNLIARMHLNDEYGNLKVGVEMGLVGTPLFARLTETRPLFVSLASEQYNAAVLSPLLGEAFDEFSGVLDGRLRAEISPPSPSEKEWTTSFSGKIDLKEGVFMPKGLGVRLNNARLQLVATQESGMNVVRLNPFFANASSSNQTVEGKATFYFQNLTLVRGDFSLEPQSLPLQLGGAPSAQLTGEILGKFTTEQELLTLALQIDRLRMDLDETSKSHLIALDENPNIDIVQALTPLETDAATSNFPWALKLQLGDNVRIKSSIIDLRIKGNPELRMGEETQMRGSIDLLPGGRFTVMGRRFTLDQGHITFATGDPANPQMSIAANWTTPSGVVVRIVVRGTLEQPKLEWTSEPALPGGEAEIIALVLGGNGGSGGGEGNVGLTPLVMAANEALGASGAGVELYMTQQEGSGEGRMATLTDTSWESYTAAFQLSEELWFEGSLQRQTTGVLEERNGVSGTLDWRFHPQWSVRTEIGTLGAGVDMLWRYRY